jgi:hypothetical protein
MTKNETPVKDRIRFALEDLPNRITIGIEVETQCESDDDDRELDTDGMAEYANANIDTHFVCSYAGIDHNKYWIAALGCTDDAPELADKLCCDWDSIVDNYVEHMDTEGWYLDSNSANWDDVGSEINRAMNRTFSDWNYCEDGSVSGPEFQSGIINGRDAAIEQAEKLFALLDDSPAHIDSDCSCHIHIRMQDVYHTGHNVLQQLIFEELFNDLDALPLCIKTRCRSRPRWIQPSSQGSKTCHTKYNPIQRHSGFGTWEFRIFGNVDDIAEFTKCLDAAIAAMHRAYTRFLAGDRKELPADLWVELAAKAMYHWTPIQAYPEFGKYWEAPQESTVARVTDETPLSEFEVEDECNCESCCGDRRRNAIQNQPSGVFEPVPAECA